MEERLCDLIKCQHCGGELESYSIDDRTSWSCSNDKCLYGYSFSDDILNFPYCCYNSGIDELIYNQAKKVIEGHFYSYDNQSEMINYILANVKVNGKCIFDYGTSPRSLFKCGDVDLFLKIFECNFRDAWGYDITKPKEER
ncbi:MAG: hypothetical protein EOL95_09370 [Bacteroidia bacterium]|nr:hypothetical protein [Bacteroidia bacterium]